MPSIKPNVDWLNGNHWATAHMCSRCGLIEYRLYDPNEGHEGNLQCVAPPSGWSRGYMNELLCQSCASSYREWRAQGGSHE